MAEDKGSTNQARCACLEVAYLPIPDGDDRMREYWACVTCGAEFVRQAKEINEANIQLRWWGDLVKGFHENGKCSSLRQFIEQQQERIKAKDEYIEGFVRAAQPISELKEWAGTMPGKYTYYSATLDERIGALEQALKGNE